MTSSFWLSSPSFHHIPSHHQVDPCPDSSKSSLVQIEDDYDQLTDQDGFFGDFCLMCGERCNTGYDAYCSPDCQLDAIRAPAASASTPTPILPWTVASPFPTAPRPILQPPYHPLPFFLVLSNLSTLPSSSLTKSCPPQLPSTSNPSECPSSSSLSISTSSSLLSSPVSLSESASVLLQQPNPSHVSSTPSTRPPPSTSIKATLARPSLSPSVALSSSDTCVHAAFALRQALGVSMLAQQSSSSHHHPFKPSFSPLSTSNWFKSLVKRTKHGQISPL